MYIINLAKFWKHTFPQKYFRGPWPLVSSAVAVCGWCKLMLDLEPTPVGVKHGFNWSSIYMHANKSNFTFPGNLTNWPHMTCPLICDLLTSWTCEGSYITSINQVKFHSNFNSSNEGNFSFWANHTTWPCTTFDICLWSLTDWTYKRFHIVSIHRVWFQFDFNFSKKASFTFSAYVTTWPQMTWPWYVTSDLINKWRSPCCIYDPTLLKIHQSMWS